MDIEEAKQLKFETECQIEDLINNYQDKTNLRVAGVFWDTYELSIHKVERLAHLKMEVKI